MSAELTVPQSPANPLALIQTAIEKGMAVDNLGKLMDLQERWERNRAAEAYAEAMNLCQQEMPVVVRDAKNSHTQSRYARLETVNQTIRPIYTKHGFSISFGEADSPVAGNMRVVADVHHIAGHTRQYHCDVPLDGTGVKGNAMMTGTQGKGSTLSYGKRYLICAIFNVTIADEDNDGNPSDGTLSEDQVYSINDLIDDCERLGAPVEMQRFWKWVGVQSLSDLRQKDYQKVVNELRRKKEKAAKGGAA